MRSHRNEESKIVPVMDAVMGYLVYTTLLRCMTDVTPMCAGHFSINHGAR